MGRRRNRGASQLPPPEASPAQAQSPDTPLPDTPPAEATAKGPGRLAGRLLAAAGWCGRHIRAIPRPRRGTAILLAVNGGLILLAIILAAVLGWVRQAPAGQQTAKLWAGTAEDARYAQVSLFLSNEAAMSYSQIYDFRDGMETKLRENSMEARNENARMWLDAFSLTDSLTAHAGGSAQQAVAATAVGGDFFYFHNFRLIHGQLISESDLLKDMVVIDDVLAWRLFGAFNVVGFQLNVGGQNCYVAGVVAQPDSWPESELYGGDTPRIFMSFELMELINPEARATCYEMVLPDPVGGFALALAQELVKADEEAFILLDNTARFGTLRLLEKVRGFGALGAQTKALALPYWENAARMAENYALLLMALILALLITPAVCLVILLVKAWRRRGQAWQRIKTGYRRRQHARWRRKQAGRAASSEGGQADQEAPTQTETDTEEILL